MTKNINWCKTSFDEYIIGMKRLNDCAGLCQSWPRGYKIFFMLSSAEHEISNPHKFIPK